MKGMLPLYASLLIGSMGAQAQTTRVQRAVGGFIPGDYFNNCGGCGCRYIGSKHSACCEACGKAHEDEYLTGNSFVEVMLAENAETMFSRHIPSVDVRYLEARGKEPAYPVNIGHIEYHGQKLLYECLTLADLPIETREPLDLRPIVCVGGQPIGRVLNAHWPEPWPVEAELVKFPVRLPEMEASWSGSIYWGGEERADRQRWKARAGQYEKAHAKRRKANKAAKKSRKKSRK